VTAWFIAIAALMLAAALALVLRPLLRAHAAADPVAVMRRRLHALQEAHAAGVLTDDEFAAKRAELDTSPASPAAPVGRSRFAFAAALTIAFALPIAALLLYRSVGDPRALDTSTAMAPPASGDTDHGQSMEAAITGLAAKLKQNPDDVEGWALLGRAYLETQRFAEARDALEHAHALDDNNADIAVAYAEAMTLAGETHRLDGKARELLEAAVKTDPKNQRGIWLLGIAAYQERDFNGAIARWKELLALLPPEAPVVQSVNAQIARAEAERDGRELPEESVAADAQGAAPSAPSGADAAAPAAATAPAAMPSAAVSAAGDQASRAPDAGAGAKLTVKVSLDAKLTAQVAPDDTLFVYAKAANGPPMPLAIQRLHAGQLPATVVLTDGMGMLPSMKLSQFPQVIVGARISKSGNAIAQSGDLQVLSKPLDVASTAPIELKIDQRVP
jgi:cytochrome c-type biogenesis protein CcmH